MKNSDKCFDEISGPMRRIATKKCHVNNSHSTCFLNKLFCHPGYTGVDCSTRQIPANPWYTDDCPNLKESITFRIDMPIDMISKGKTCKNQEKINDLAECAYLCFSHPDIGVAQIPIVLWKLFQQNEAEVWHDMLFGNSSSDRGKEHLQGFDQYKSLPINLGNYIEVGSGPFTQTQFIIDRNFKKISLLDPGAEGYKIKSPGCTYKNNTLLGKNVNIHAIGAEKLNEIQDFGKFDTLLSVNVIEHVWDAFKFLTNIHKALKPGGILIFHERFYPTPLYGDAVLGAGNLFHPIRLQKNIYEHFLNHFKTIYMFEGQTTDQIERKAGEVGFYFIGSKI